MRLDRQHLEFLCNGELLNAIPLARPVDTTLDDEFLVGAFPGQPIPEFLETRSLCLSNARLDTVALWSDFLTDSQVAYLSGLSKLRHPQEPRPTEQAICAYNQFFDASQSKDLALCDRLENVMRAHMERDPTRPVYHLTAPMGWIFDPSGAFQFEGKYHVLSYRNIYALLRFNSQDHYVSDDLVRWRMLPTGPLADNKNDYYGIYLANHFLDREGLPNLIYGGFDERGEQGIRAVSRDGMISYGEKKVVLPEYHDGHVWREGDIWYAVTMRRVAKRMIKDAEVVIFSSTDLEQWQERGVLLRTSEYLPGKDQTSFEFPYLFSLGGKDVLMGGNGEAGVLYWIGHFDRKAFKFIPDHRDPFPLDYANPFHCFNPSAVDFKGSGNEPRRIIMAMYPFLGGDVAGLPWEGVHAMPRVLSLDGDHLRQDPLPEFEALRAKHHSLEDVSVTPHASGYIDVRGDALEIHAEFANRDASLFGMLIRLSHDRKSFVRIFYDARTNEYGVDGNVADVVKKYSKAKGPTYIPPGKPVLLRLFLDKGLVESFVNGQTCTVGLGDMNPANIGLDFFSEGGTVTCKRLDVWEMKRAF